MPNRPNRRTPSVEEFTLSAGDVRPILGLAPRINGNHTVQSSMVPVSFLPLEEDEKREPGAYFSLLVVGGMKGPSGIVADLSYNTEKVFAASVIFLEIEFDGPDGVGIKNEEEGRALGKWATHVAYDFAALALRQLVANNQTTIELDLPLAPLEPEIEVRIRTEEVDGS